MMNNRSKNSLILLIFCLNVLSLIFLGESNSVLVLINKLLSVLGLAWIVYFNFKILNLSSDLRNNQSNHTKIDRTVVDYNPESQFSDLIDSSFALVKGISNDFEVGIYFYQPDSKLLELKNSTSSIFIDSLSLDVSFVKNLFDPTSNIISKRAVNVFITSSSSVTPVDLPRICLTYKRCFDNVIILGFIDKRYEVTKLKYKKHINNKILVCVMSNTTLLPFFF